MKTGQAHLQCIRDNAEVARAKALAFRDGYAAGYKAGRVDCRCDEDLSAYDRGKTDGYLQAIAEAETGDYEPTIALVG